MARITLDFTNSNSPELFRIRFEHHLQSETIESNRGKTSGALNQNPTFQWTSAVRALCVLLIETARAITKGKDPRSQESCAALTGESPSLASTLDYALGKEPLWLKELFGLDLSGKPLLRRLFKRSNPDRKYPGPTAVSLNAAGWQVIHIDLKLGGVFLRSEAEMKLLSKKISGDSTIPHKEEELAPHQNPLRIHLQELIIEELKCTLSGTDIFSHAKLIEAATSISKDPSFCRIAGKNRQTISHLDEQLSPSARLGLQDEKAALRLINQREPLRVALCVPSTGTNALFYYLKHIKGYNFDLEIINVHAVETARRLIKGEYAELPDLCVFGTAPTASMLSSKTASEFAPLMLMPHISQALITPSLKAVDFSGKYYFLNDDPSVPSFTFDELLRRQFVKKNRIQIKHREPDEVFALFREKTQEIKTIQFFPHYKLNILYNSCTELPFPQHNTTIAQTILFARLPILREPKLAACIDIALRNAWLELKANPGLQKSIAQIMLDDEDYLRTFLRASGLHYLVSNSHNVRIRN